MDYMIFVGVIMLVLIPLLVLSMTNFKPYNTNSLSETLEVVQDSIRQISVLGAQTSSQVIIHLPLHLLDARVNGKTITLTTEEDTVSLDMPIEVIGVFPRDKGTHYLKIYHNGSNAFLYECGNNKIEAFEQCDGKENNLCGLGANVCYTPGDQRECRCSCTNNFECATNYCDVETHACGYCDDDDDCSPGEICQFGKCIG